MLSRPSDPATADILAMAFEAYRTEGPARGSSERDTRTQRLILDLTMFDLVKRGGRGDLAGCFHSAIATQVDKDADAPGGPAFDSREREWLVEIARDMDREFGPRWREKAEAGLCADTVR